MAKKRVKKGVSRSFARAASAKGMTSGLAIVALILNVLIIPGLGTLVAGRIKAGVWQIALLVIGAILVSIAYVYEASIFYVGSPLMIVAWIWGLVTGISLIQESR